MGFPPLSSCGPAQLIPSKGLIQKLSQAWHCTSWKPEFLIFKLFHVVCYYSFILWQRGRGTVALRAVEQRNVLGKETLKLEPQVSSLFPHLTGWQADGRSWPSICEYQLKARNPLTCWLLEFKLAVYIVSIKDLCQKPLFPCSVSSGLHTTLKGVSKSLPVALKKFCLTPKNWLHTHVIWLLKYYHSNRHQFYGFPLPFVPTA